MTIDDQIAEWKAGRRIERWAWYDHCRGVTEDPATALRRWESDAVDCMAIDSVNALRLLGDKAIEYYRLARKRWPTT